MKKAVAFITLVVALLALAAWLDPVREGLNGAYFANAAWTDPPAVSTRDPQPSNERLLEAWHGSPPLQFSVTWAGSLLVMRDGTYALATISDDSSAVFVDGQPVVDNGGRRVRPRGASGAIALTRGVHAIYVRYAREDGPLHFELLWARAGEELERVPSWALTPRRVSFAAFAASAARKRSLAVAEWAWVAAIVIWALTVAWWWFLRGRLWLQREQVWSTLRWILTGSLILNAVGIWWGLPGGSWAPDEVSPAAVMGGAASLFAHGWFDRYPPFHFYVLTAAFSPLLLLERLGRIDLSASTPFAVLTLVGRLVSLAAGVGTLLAIYSCGARTFGQRAGIFATAVFAVVTPFVYYAKTANLDVPYLFWFAVSLVFYLRVLEHLRLADVIGFAASATIAVCTKDQAYGLYLLTPFAIVYHIWRANRDAGVQRPLTRALFDARLGWAAVIAMVLFVAGHNLPFNVSGFAEHVRYITGGGSESYREFEPTLAGRLALLRLTVELVRVSWGWPMFLVCVAGFVLAVAAPGSRRFALWLALPVVSYYAGFVNVVLYNYDRFMLPVCLVLSLFGGLALDRATASGRGQPLRLAAAAAVLACTMLYAATVDLVMLRDSRYRVEQWLAARVGPHDVVAFVFPLQYYPRLERFTHIEITSIPQLKADQPAYYVLNADYGSSEPAGSEIGRLIAGLQNGQLGYQRVLRFREPSPWPWLPGRPRDVVGDRRERPVTSVLRHINPWYEVFRHR